MLTQCRGLRTDDVPVITGKLRFKTSSQTDGHRQGGSGWTRVSVAHTHTYWAVGNPKAWDPQLLDTLYMALHLKLSHEQLLLLCAHGIYFICRRQSIDIDRLHGSVKLGNFLLQGHGGNELLGTFMWRQRLIHPRKRIHFCVSSMFIIHGRISSHHIISLINRTKTTLIR